ncbi:MAG: hypothetical protein Q8N53_09040 [Longimicrobiales bacterium]|nr:hypothetical protein [Longimicrobiales bacterium]
MNRQQPGKQGPDWDATVSRAVDHLDESDQAVAEADARRARSTPGMYVLVALTLLAVVVAWNVWAFTRAPEVPPDPEVAFALRQTAGALAAEVFAVQARQGRLPTTAELELADLVDEELTYALAEGGFVITNTDGVIQVTYDGSVPVGEWVANGGHTLVGGSR